MLLSDFGIVCVFGDMGLMFIGLVLVMLVYVVLEVFVG